MKAAASQPFFSSSALVLGACLSSSCINLPPVTFSPLRQLSRHIPDICSSARTEVAFGPQATARLSPLLNRTTTERQLSLIVCGFVSGLVDGLSFNAWGSFSSMQTGNTVFIALGASGQPRYPAYLWAKSLIALCTFIASNIIFIQASRLLGPPRRRSSLILSFAVQSICLLVAALLVELRIVSPRPEDPRAPIQWMQIIPISLLAFQAGGQVCASRILEFDEIPTVVLTSLLCDLLVDPNLLARKNPKRDRRVGAFLALFLGAMTAGGLSKVASLASSLWFAFGLKVMITGAWTVWKTEGSGRVGKGGGSIV